MKIDIDQLSEIELTHLNRRIVQRLRFLQKMRTHHHMLQFTIGQSVSFEPSGNPRLFGIIAKYNQKTVTVITSDGQGWNVSPSLLRKITDCDSHSGATCIEQLPE